MHSVKTAQYLIILALLSYMAALPAYGTINSDSLSKIRLKAEEGDVAAQSELGLAYMGLAHEYYQLGLQSGGVGSWEEAKFYFRNAIGRLALSKVLESPTDMLRRTSFRSLLDSIASEYRIAVEALRQSNDDFGVFIMQYSGSLEDQMILLGHFSEPPEASVADSIIAVRFTALKEAQLLSQKEQARQEARQEALRQAEVQKRSIAVKRCSPADISSWEMACEKYQPKRSTGDFLRGENGVFVVAYLEVTQRLSSSEFLVSFPSTPPRLYHCAVPSYAKLNNLVTGRHFRAIVRIGDMYEYLTPTGYKNSVQTVHVLYAESLP